MSRGFRRGADGLTKPERFGVPGKLVLDNFQYAFKDLLKNDKLSYRCRSKNCGVLLTISKEELNKLNNNSGIEIYYDLNKKHICYGIINKTINVKDVITDHIEKGRVLINASLDKPLSWHINNLIDYNIKLTVDQIKDILYAEIDKRYQSDNVCLNNINNITISFDDNDTSLKDLPFCYTVKKILNPQKNFREERFIIYTSLYQMKHFINSTDIYIDINYKSAPKGYYQIISLISYCKELKTYLPVFIVPMTHKSKISYYNIFKSIISIIKQNKLSFSTNNNLVFICDFEKCLREVIKKVFPNCTIYGNFFHYYKNIWTKAKKFNLCKANNIIYTKNIIFALGLIVLIKSDNIKKYLNQINQYIKTIPEENDLRKNYELFLQFFKNKWSKTKYIHFEKIYNEEWHYRTDDIIESFHTKLSKATEMLFPKMSLLIYNIQEVVRSYYPQIDYKLKNVHQNDENEEKKEETVDKNINTFQEMFELMNNFHKKYKKILEFNDILNFDESNKHILDEIIYYNLKSIFGLKCISEKEDKNNYDKNNYDFDEIQHILEDKKEGKKEEEKEQDKIDKNEIKEEKEDKEKDKKEEKKKIKNYDYIDIDIKEEKNKKKSYEDLKRFEELYDMDEKTEEGDTKMDIN